MAFTPATPLEAVEALYIGYFGRAGEPGGVQYWVDQIQAGRTFAQVAAAFSVQAEAKATHPFLANPDLVPADQFVESLYTNLLERASDATGKAYWVAQVTAAANNPFALGLIVAQFISGATGDDILTLQNKIDAAEYFTGRLAASNIQGTDAQGQVLPAVDSAATSIIDKVTKDATTVATAKSETDTFVANGGTGGTGTSTSFTDKVGEALQGGGGNDTFSGVLTVGNAAQTTANVGDSANGAGGTDTLNLLVATGGGPIPAGFTTSSVEIVNINYAAGAAALTGLASSSFGGVQQLWQIDNDGTGNYGAVALGAGVTAGFRSTGTTGASVATATVTVDSGVTSAAVALDGVLSGSAITLAETTATNLSTVSVSGSVASTAAVAAIPAGPGPDGILVDDPATPGNEAADNTPAVPAVPAANNLTLSAAGTTDIDNLNLSLTSNTTVTITSLDDLNKLDASGSTGNLTVNLGTPDELVTATFGSGSDTVTLNTSGLNATTPATTVSLGAGNDTIVLSAGANANPSALTINLGAGNDTVDVDVLTNLTAVTAAGVTADLVTVTDFVAASDVLNLATLGTRDVLSNTELANINGSASLDAALTLAASLTTVGQYSVFNFGGNAYVYDQNGTAAFDAGDGLMMVVGLQVEQFTATNLIV